MSSVRASKRVLYATQLYFVYNAKLIAGVVTAHRKPTSTPRLSAIPARCNSRSSSGREGLVVVMMMTAWGRWHRRRRRYRAAGAFAPAAAFGADDRRHSRRKPRFGGEQEQAKG